MGLQMALYLSAIILGVTRKYVSPKQRKVSGGTTYLKNHRKSE